MATEQYGNLTYKFGFQDAAAETLATSIGMVPEELNIEGEPEFTAEAFNSGGETVSKIVGGKKKSFTLSGYLIDKDDFDAATDFEYGGDFFIVEGTRRTENNRDFNKCELRGTSYPLIAAPAP